MKKRLLALLAALCMLFAMNVCAQEATAGEAESELTTTTEYRWFVNQYRNTRGATVTYYDNVYAYNHGDYALTPFDSHVPAEYFVVDETGAYAVAPIVLDITDAMRVALYGEDIGETAMFYGQYCERIVGKKGREGFSGVHEGIDFKAGAAVELHAILGGEVIRAGDSDGTVAVYNEDYGVTVLYLHCEEIGVRRGDIVEAGDLIAVEGKKGSGGRYTHVEMRIGRFTSANAYRNTKLESDCPYPVMQEALGVVPSGRQPMTAAAVLRAQKMREEAEAAAAAAKALEEKAQAEKNAEPEIELVDNLPGTQSGYGFAETTPSTPEATLPPSNP